MIAQYTWDPYGQVLTAEYAGLASTYNKLGHHGLFADRLDAGYQSATLAAGFVSSTHLPARIVYNVRNRTYEPSTQRWLQRDPNATGQVVLGSLASGGQAMSGAVSAIELSTLYGDGMSLYGYVGSAPVQANDPTGLVLSLLGPTSTLEFQLDHMEETLSLGDDLRSLAETIVSNYGAAMEDAFDAIMDWSERDDLMYSVGGVVPVDEFGSGGASEAPADNGFIMAGDEDHHIVPKFLGGDDIDNIVPMSKVDHDNFHKYLREEFKRERLLPPSSGKSNRWIVRLEKGKVGDDEAKAVGRALRRACKRLDSEVGAHVYQLSKRASNLLNTGSSGKLLRAAKGARAVRRYWR